MKDRTVAAFAVAPWVVPAFVAPIYAGNLSGQWIMTMVIVAAICAYATTVVIGIPLYLILRDWQLTQIWAFVPAGFVAGGFSWMIFMAMTVGKFTAESVAWPGGAMGAAYGLVFWLIARPDIKAPTSAAATK